jgi:hypothetical protein
MDLSKLKLTKAEPKPEFPVHVLPVETSENPENPENVQPTNEQEIEFDDFSEETIEELELESKLELESESEQSEQSVQSVSTSLGDIPDDNCSHLCDCGKWWSHGSKTTCKYPDMVKQGPCQDCNSGGTFQINFEDNFITKDGKTKLTSDAQKISRNEARKCCKDMGIEQLTAHILYYEMRIEQLRAHSLEAAAMRREREEEALRDIPEHEQEKFRQALRQPKKARKSAPKKLSAAKQREADLVAKLKSQGKSTQDAHAIASIMISMNKSQAIAEKYLND